MKKLLPISTAVALITLLVFSGCKKDKDPVTLPTEPTHNLVLKYKFDSTQVRLNNIGQPATMPAGHAGLSPVFNKMSSHYIELAPNMWTALGQGTVLYLAPETTAGGDNAIDFSKSTFAGNGEVFFKMPLKNITPGEYEWLQISLAYQNYDIKYYIDDVIGGFPIQQEFDGTVASFIGYNSYISSYKVKDSTVIVNANKKQGYWAGESSINFMGTDYGFVTEGQAPEGATTVPNPIFATSPVPQGSCVVTAAFQPGKLVITGNETKDIVVEVSLSTNKSFEWEDDIPDGRWEPGKNKNVVDMGIRGMVPTVQ
jgi:hypothetical protein